MTNRERGQPEVSNFLQAVSHEVRRDVFKTILRAESGHLGGCSSSTELLTALYFGGVLRFDPENPQDPNRDRVLIRGHEGPLRYKILSMAGFFSEDELEGYREFGSRLKGHEDMDTTPGVDITPSGSLGMLLSYGVGSAIVAKNIGLGYRTFVFLGDGEEQEGNVSEAARHAGSLGLDNLVCVLDRNRKQLSRSTVENDRATDIAKVWEGYGWEVRTIEDGNSLEQVMETYQGLDTITRPTLIIANTEKGKGLDGNLENFCGYHTITNCDPEIIEAGIVKQQELLDQTGFSEADIDQEIKDRVARVCPVEVTQINEGKGFRVDLTPDASLRNLEKAQDAYLQQLREVLTNVAEAPSLYLLNADFVWGKSVKKSGLEEFSHFYDVGIREQHLVAMAHGISTTDPEARIVLHYGDPFLYRAADQINAAAQGHSKFMIFSRMSGLTMDRNGKTHQSSGQPGLIETMPGVGFYEPADVKDLYNIYNWFVSENPGLVYVRAHRVNIDALERSDKDLRNINYYVTFDSGRTPDLVLVSSGFLVAESIDAAKRMETEDGLAVRVINVVNPKSVDQGFVGLTENDRPLMTVYNGNPIVLQNPVARAVMESSSTRPSLVRSCGFEFGDTGRLKDLLRHYKLDGEGIRQTAKEKLFGGK